MKDGAGRVLGSVAVVREITTRFQAEKERRKRLAELEAQVAARRREAEAM